MSFKPGGMYRLPLGSVLNVRAVVSLAKLIFVEGDCGFG